MVRAKTVHPAYFNNVTPAYDAVFFKWGSITYAENRKGDQIAQGSNSVSVINAAISWVNTYGGGTVYGIPATYTIGVNGTSGSNVGGTPVLMRSNVWLKGGPGTILKLADYQSKTGTDITGGVPNIISTADWSAANVNSDIKVSDLELDGNKANQNQTSPGTEHDALNLTGATNFVIDNMYIHDTYSDGLDFDYCENGRISNCFCEDCDGSGYHTSNGGGTTLKPITETPTLNVRFVNCHSDSNGSRLLRAGFLLAGGVSGDRCNHVCSVCTSKDDSRGFAIDQAAQYCKIVNCAANNPSGDGIIIDSTRCTVMACSINNGGRNGIKVTNDRNIIKGNHCWNNGDANTANEQAGINIDDALSCLVEGNYCYDEQSGSNRTQQYGIAEYGTSDSNIYIQNYVTNNETANMLIIGANSIYRENFGWTTEAKGTSSVLSGSTSVAVTHGLAYTPAAGEISIAFTENPSNTPRFCYVTAIGATTFTVNVDSDPGASNLDFGWSVRKI